MRDSNRMNNNQSSENESRIKIPFLEGRPSREKVIGESDIANLKIALNTCKNLEEFLGRV